MAMFSKKLLAALLPAILLSGCATAPTTSATPTPAAFTACLIADSKGLKDNGVNESAYSAIKEAVVSLGVDKHEKVVSAKATPEQIYNQFNRMIRRGCQILVATGASMRGPIINAAQANPDLAFVFIDESLEPLTKVEASANLKRIAFDSGQSAILAGYLAAATTKTGTVATLGSFDTIPVRASMQGFLDGVNLFNDDTDSDVQVLGAGDSGWKFIGSYTSKPTAMRVAAAFIDQGADVIYAVASSASIGAGLATLKHPGTMIIGSDRDWYMDHDNFAWRNNILASTVKQVSRPVYAAIATYVEKQNLDVSTNEHLGNLENSGVSITDERSIAYPPQYNSELSRLRRSIISGEIPTPKGTN